MSLRTPCRIIVDGYIATAGILVAAKLEPKVTENIFLSTLSGENGHKIAVEELKKIALQENNIPLSPCALDMNLRLGEGTGATLAIPLMKTAAKLLKMARLKDLL